MKLQSNIRKTLIALSLVMVFIFTTPAYAADGNDESDNNVNVINYDDIEDLVLENNLRLKSNKYSIEDMEDIIDDIHDARDEIREMLSKSSGSGPSMPIEMPSSTDVREKMQLAELSFAYAERKIINGSQELFVILKQVDKNLVLLERNSQTLSNQLEKIKLSYKYGYALSSQVDELEYKLEQIYKDYNSLLQQRDLLLLQFKNLIGASSSEEIMLGQIPELDIGYISEIDYESDLKEAIKNSMSIEILKKELRNADASSKKISTEVKIRKTEIDVELTNQYQLILQKHDELLLARNNLNLQENELLKGYIQLNAGNITKSNLDSLINEVKNQKSIIEIAESNLFMEVEKYKAMVGGMI